MGAAEALPPGSGWAVVPACGPEEGFPGEPLPPGRWGPLRCSAWWAAGGGAENRVTPALPPKPHAGNLTPFPGAQAVSASSQPGARCPVPGEGLTQTLGVRAALDSRSLGPGLAWAIQPRQEVTCPKASEGRPELLNRDLPLTSPWKVL